AALDLEASVMCDETRRVVVRRHRLRPGAVVPGRVLGVVLGQRDAGPDVRKAGLGDEKARQVVLAGHVAAEALATGAKTVDALEILMLSAQAEGESGAYPGPQPGLGVSTEITGPFR